MNGRMTVSAVPAGAGRGRAPRVVRRAVCAGLALALVIGLVEARKADADPYVAQEAQQEPAIAGNAAGPALPAPADPAAAAAARPRPRPVWPAAGTAEVTPPVSTKPSPTGAGTAGEVPAGSLPVLVGPAGGTSGSTGTGDPDGTPGSGSGAAAPSRLRVELLDRKATTSAGVEGLVLRVGRTDGVTAAGRVRLSVDYRAFQDAYGGDWSTRLRLVRLPECALATPAEPACRPTPVRSANDPVAGRVTAEVDVAGTATSAVSSTSSAAAFAEQAAGAGLLALSAGPSGAAGSFAATSLTPSSTWQAGGSSGDFSWSYPMRLPPGLGGPAPEVSLAYSSQGVDGRTAASNNQPSWAGEGHELWPGGYIERRYKGCADDMGGGANNTAKTGDECWATDNATMSLNGRTTELVRDGATGAFRPRNEDGSRVERLTGASNGDADGEHWRITTTNGTQYWFGLNRLTGWSAGRPETRSAWTVPVFGNHAGEPCHAATFAASSCDQAWRWNLDYVVDPHGSTMSLWYSPETNRYGRNLTATDAVTYTRGGTLDRIDYGTDNRSGTDSGLSGPAPARVLFTSADRCLSGCATHDGAHWPDTPWDQSCAASPCTASQNGPTFWTTRRLAAVKTQVWGGSAHRDVESWTLTHSYPNPGDGTRAGLWLASISHQGLVGPATAVPDVTFTGVQMNNRVDGLDHSPAMNWWRIADVTSESGGRTSVRYSERDCLPGSRMPASPEANTLRCYPVIWTPEGYTDPVRDWFHKYVATAVTETDTTGGTGAALPPRKLTTYQYLGDPAWHYATDDGLTLDKYRTWSEWRGYARVGVTVGDTDVRPSYSEARYFRGMNGDHLPSGSRSVTVTDSQGGTWPDDDWLAGTAREQTTYDGPGGPEVSASISDPWVSAPTATRTINGVTVTARYTNTADVRTRVALDGGRGWRRTRTHTDFDAYGMPASAEDAGDEAVTGDEQCTRTTYARNPAAWLLTYTSRVQTFAVSCARAAQPGALGADDVVGDGRTSFDGGAWGAAPTRGDTTRVEQLSAWDAGNPTYTTVSRSAFDPYGRVTDTWDVLDRHTGTAYTPAAGGPLTRTTETNPLGHTTTADLEAAWGAPVATTDANDRRTDLAYDGLGRLTRVWLPGRDKAANPDTPSASHAYLVRTDGATAVTSRTLNATGGYSVAYALYDSLLRPRQTQAAAEGTQAGRVLTDTRYDSAGRAFKTSSPFFNTAAPGTDLFVPGGGDATIPAQTVTAFDGAGRTTASAFVAYGTERWRTTTAYGGDRTDVTPPAGATATSTVVDEHGRTVELRQYHGPRPTPTVPDSYDATTYAIDRKGRQTRVTDAAGNHWDYAYDLRGRQVRVDDPDKGPTTMAYDDAGQVVATTDARQQTTATTYDALGRRTSVRDGSASGPKRAEWVYDTVARGVPYSSTRYAGGNAYTTTVTAVDAGYRPLSTTVSIPAAEGPLAGAYTYATTYKADGSPDTTRVPAAGDLPGETLTTGYDTLGKPATLSTSINATTYVAGTSYTAFAEPAVTTYRTGGGRTVQVGLYYEDSTRRLDRTWVTRETAPATIADVRYTRDPGGNLTRIADTPPDRPADTQCFANDHLLRLVEAWTPTSGDCATAPSTAGLGGPAPYWQGWTYDRTGNRLTQTDHRGAGDTTTSYTHPAAGQPQAHTVRSATVTGPGGGRTASYGYDAAGNTVSRPGVAGGTQTLTWDAEGRLATATDNGAATGLVYDADGGRLLRRDATGTTLYLPGQELRLSAATGTVATTRFYAHNDDVVAQRTATGLTWLVADWQDTQQTTVVPATQAVTQRRQTPYGRPRGTVVSWPNEHGFVDGTVDPTGLTHLGAREYDADLGAFLSVDPIVDPSNPQQLNAYAYGDDSPVTFSDPDGLCAGRDYGDLCPGQKLETQWQAGPIPEGYQSPWNPGRGGGGNNDDGGGGKPKPKPKSCKWYDAKCKAKKAWNATTNFVEEHKAAIAGFAAGLATGVICGAAIGWTGAGAVACGALAGAVGSVVHDMVEGGHGWKEMVGNAVLGATVGALTGGLASVGGSALGAGVRAASGGIRAAGRAAVGAGRSEFGNLGRFSGGLVGRGRDFAAQAARARRPAYEPRHENPKAYQPRHAADDAPRHAAPRPSRGPGVARHRPPPVISWGEVGKKTVEQYAHHEVMGVLEGLMHPEEH
jgi:RHS repeat-associated protein